MDIYESEYGVTMTITLCFALCLAQAAIMEARPLHTLSTKEKGGGGGGGFIVIVRRPSTYMRLWEQGL